MIHRLRPRTWLTITFALIVVLVTACSSSPSANQQKSDQTALLKKATHRLADALSRKNVSSVNFAGSKAVDKRFTKLIEPLGSARLTAKPSGNPKVDNDQAESTITMSWHIPGAQKPWKYTVHASWKRSEASAQSNTADNNPWQPVWKPSLVQPDLTAGAKLTLHRKQPRRGKIIGAHDKSLVTRRAVIRVGIDKSKISGKKTAGAAKELAELVDIDPDSYIKQVESAGKQAFVKAIVFRANDADRPSAAKIDEIDGAVGLDDHAMLAPSKSFAAPILGTVGSATKEQVDQSKGSVRPGDQVGQSGLQSRYDQRLRGTPSISVRVVPPEHAASPRSSSPSASTSAEPLTHTKKVYKSAGSAGKDLTITLDTKRQKLAEDAVEDLKPASSLVAIRPSTGAVVAAATNAAGDGRNLATYGQYPPGSTFKIVDALALIRAGVKPSDHVTCPSHITVNGRKFTNYSEYPSSKLGTIDLKTAFANSCNTAFIGMRKKVDAHDLNEAAASLGAGTDYDVGFPAYFGSIPKPASQTERAAEMIGQGRVQMSPLALATVTASVQHGKTVLPQLVKKKSAEPKGKPLTGSEAKQLTKLMGAVVDQGSGKKLQSLEPPQVIAKTGTAEYGNAKPPKTHAWMVGGQDDLAVAVFVDKGKSGSGVAGPALQEFLENA